MVNDLAQKKAALYEAWRRGLLTYKLDSFQKELAEAIKKTEDKVTVVLSSRRLGKSFFATVCAIQQCLSKPNSIVKYLAPTKLMVNTYLRPLFREILSDCPDDFQPSMVKNQFTYYFQNGSEIQLAGSDGGHAEKLRGSYADLCIVDEAGFCSDLENVVRSILIPTTMNTKGKILLLSTPPKDPEHDFIKFVEEADLKDGLIKKTIYDNPRIKPEEIESIIAAYPKGKDDPDFQREYLCKITRDASLMIVPEFTDEVQKEIVKEWPKPPYYECYESMDIGFHDMTVVLFAYYDFRAAKIVVEDELIMQGSDIHIPKLVVRIKEKEIANWTNVMINEITKPKLRISDINYIVTQEIARASGDEIYFQATRKDDKEAAINNVRVLIETKKIIINPRCQTLIKHIKNAKWSGRKERKEFARGADGSHFDALDALIYLCRNIDYSHNPYPSSYALGLRPVDSYFTPSHKDKQYSANIQAFKKIFSRTTPQQPTLNIEKQNTLNNKAFKKMFPSKG
jgi:hypothetical protein